VVETDRLRQRRQSRADEETKRQHRETGQGQDQGNEAELAVMWRKSKGAEAKSIEGMKWERGAFVTWCWAEERTNVQKEQANE
jgi:hypothetical protein